MKHTLQLQYVENKQFLYSSKMSVSVLQEACIETRDESIHKIFFHGADLAGIKLHGVAEDHNGHTNVQRTVQEVVPTDFVRVRVEEEQQS